MMAPRLQQPAEASGRSLPAPGTVNGLSLWARGRLRTDLRLGQREGRWRLRRRPSAVATRGTRWQRRSNGARSLPPCFAMRRRRRPGRAATVKTLPLQNARGLGLSLGAAWTLLEAAQRRFIQPVHDPIRLKLRRIRLEGAGGQRREQAAQMALRTLSPKL